MIERLSSQAGRDIGGDHQRGAACRRRARHPALRHRGPRRRRSRASSDNGHADRQLEVLRTIGIPLLGGRAFNDLDSEESQPVVVINKSMAKYWDGADPVGSRISADRGEHWLTVVGVVGDVRQFGLAQETVAQLYIPLTQTPQGFAGQVLVRTAGNPASFANVLRNTVHTIDANLPVEEVQTLDDLRSEALAAPRLTATLLAIFATLALLVTLAGIGGVIATSGDAAHQGIRIANGARRQPRQRVDDGDQAGIVLRADRFGMGVAGALAAGRVLNAYLYQTRRAIR
jgi:hypothetical protein